MDQIFIEAVVCELRDTLRGAAVNKVHQPGPHEIVLRLWNGRENLRLLLCTSPAASRIHLTETKLPNPQNPPRFSQLLRSRLTRLLEIERVAGERIVRMVFAGEKGEGRWTLVAELLGARANLLLLDGEGVIVDALRRSEEKGREIRPGQPYLPPESSLRADLEAAVPTIPRDVTFRTWLLENVSPMTPLVAEDLASAVEAGASPDEVLGRFRRRWLEREFSPCIASLKGKPLLSAFTPEHIASEDVQTFQSASGAADAFFGEGRVDEVFGGGRTEVDRVVRKAVKKLRKRLEHISGERDEALQAERMRETGDLLLGNLHRMRKGMAEVVLDDWYADPPGRITVPLDPALSPQENAERYFRRHRKGKRGLEHTERRRLETEAELEWLEGVALALEEALESEDVAALRSELEEGGVLRPEAGRRPRPRQAKPEAQVRSTLSPGGYLLFWGKNNRTNDYVSKQMTAAEDLWFHSHNMPGCHLVLKRGKGGDEVPEEDVLYAASIAAGHSRGKRDGKVEVMVAEGKAVRKPKGVRPGLVTVDRYRTVVVRPCRPEEKVEKTES